jgi:hypothetical protein
LKARGEGNNPAIDERSLSQQNADCTIASELWSIANGASMSIRPGEKCIGTIRAAFLVKNPRQGIAGGFGGRKCR